MKLFIYIIIFILFVNIAESANKDSLKNFKSENINITAKRLLSPFEAVFYGTDFNSQIYDKNGNFVIRRGMNFTQDVYSEGFKRNDIKVIIDGEQYHNACPNRMDAAAGRINPLEMESVEMTKSGSLRGTGIYGKIEYQRKEFPDEFKLGSFFTGNMISQQEFDLGLSLSGKQQGIIARFSGGNPYQSGAGKDFKELYNYKDNFSYFNTKVSFRGKSGDFTYGVSFNRLEDISFPYLSMDEVATSVYNADISWKKQKIYFNYTDHLMDNTLRVSPMFMESHAKNLTIGMVGDFYEITYQNWNADNRIINPAMNVDMGNNMIPEISRIYAAINHKIHFNDFGISGRIGLITNDIGNKSANELYSTLYNDVEGRKYYISGAVNLNYAQNLGDYFSFGTGAEFAFEAPEAEQLYINVRRPGTNPNWVGNPNLLQPKKAAARMSLSSEYFSFETYFNYVMDFVNLASSKAGEKNVLTYQNVNAMIGGVNLNVKYKYFQSNISYIYGENIDNNNPLPEIMPLSVTNILEFPEIWDIQSAIIHRYENFQPRIDSDLNEFQSDSWNTFSVRFGYKIKDIAIRIEADNLLNHNYFRHLSFARNPFSAGLRVYEPGTTLRLTIVYDKIFN